MSRRPTLGAREASRRERISSAKYYRLPRLPLILSIERAAARRDDQAR